MTTLNETLLFKSVNELAETLKFVAGSWETMQEQNAAVAALAVKLLTVMKAHMGYLSELDKSRFETELKARGLSFDGVVAGLVKITKKEV